jgi:hypothetical protein
MPDGAGDDAKLALRDNQAAQDACQPILDRLPAAARKNSPPTPEELRGLLGFAQCMRENGLPEWPDPQADGTFPLPEPLRSEGKSPRLVTAERACEHFISGKKGIQVK